MEFGKYRLIKKLATGGMAEVFLAKAAGPMGFEKNLVIKRILPHLAEDPQFVQMFLAEARLAALLNHPNIVQIFDFGEFEDTYYLAMEYIDGPNLRTLSRRAREAGVQLPPVYCAKIISHACDGLAFAHDFVSPETGEPLQLIHRDVSPDNILLSRQGAVKVVDFGIAKAANQEHKTQTGMVKGKLAYMPPEQLQGQPLDRRVDVYALGVVLYELLTGQKPFDFEPFVPATQRRPDLPRALSRILERALGNVREHRYPDCRAFQADLDRFIYSSGEMIGVWQLSQLVLGVLGEAPPGVSMVVPSSALTDAEAAEDAEEADEQEEPLPSAPRRRVGRWVIWASLLLLVLCCGVWGSLPPAPAPAPTPALPQMGTLEFRIRPYAIVVLDGKQLGQTPLSPTEVAAGTHSVLLINKELRKAVTQTVEVKAGQVHVFKHNLLEE